MNSKSRDNGGAGVNIKPNQFNFFPLFDQMNFFHYAKSKCPSNPPSSFLFAPQLYIEHLLLLWEKSSLILGLKGWDSEFWQYCYSCTGFKDPYILGFKDSRILIFKDSGILGYQDSRSILSLDIRILTSSNNISFSKCDGYKSCFIYSLTVLATLVSN